ncbi:MAG: DUF4956 domain-containing protein [Paludibacteraceae bacterium]|nr:DUF4956 domain-containing protein [Paludibacteraceae bacterium]
MGYEVAGNTLDFLGVPLFDAPSLINLAVRFLFNLLVCWLLVHFCYYRKSRRRDYYTTFMLFSSTMFLLIFLMENVSMQIGFTLGLFAIFGMIRYRTETVPIREMTYLFVIIGISVINGLAMTVSYAELLATNLLLLLLTVLFENARFLRHRASKVILYEKIENIRPERRGELIADIEQRTGIKVESLEIGHVDFLRDVAYIKIYYNDNQADSAFGNATKLKQMGVDE